MTHYVTYSPALGDLDLDGTLEIMVGVHDGIYLDDGESRYAFHQDGTVMTGWLQRMWGDSSAPAVADLDRDGRLEVVVYNG